MLQYSRYLSTANPPAWFTAICDSCTPWLVSHLQPQNNSATFWLARECERPTSPRGFPLYSRLPPCKSLQRPNENIVYRRKGVAKPSQYVQMSSGSCVELIEYLQHHDTCYLRAENFGDHRLVALTTYNIHNGYVVNWSRGSILRPPCGVRYDGLWHGLRRV